MADKTIGASRPKTFEIDGIDYEFRLATVHPEDYAEALKEMDDLYPTAENGQTEVVEGEAVEGETPADTPAVEAEGPTFTDIIRVREKRILLSIVEDDHPVWHEAREAKKIDLAMMKELLEWMTEVHTGRPLQLGMPSLPGPGSRDPSSTETAPAQVVRPRA